MSVDRDFERTLRDWLAEGPTMISGRALAETLAFDVATRAWTRFDDAGTPPSARFAASAIYDSLADRVLVYGGDEGRSCGDLWALELGGAPRWRELHPLGVAVPPGAWSLNCVVISFFAMTRLSIRSTKRPRKF